MNHSFGFRGRAALALITSTFLGVPLANAQTLEAEAEELVVIGYKAQSAQAIAAKRAEERIADFLSADDIGAQPDYNISDAIRRLPGVQTVFDEDEGKFVSIRGLNPSYTLGALNGSTLATSERGNRQVNLEAVPSGAVRQVAVIKSRTPDVDGNAIGGALNLITRSPFDADGLYVSGTAMVGYSTDTDVPGDSFTRSYDDALNTRLDLTASQRFGDRDQFGVLVGVNFFQRNRDQQRLLPQVVPAAISETPTPAATLGATDLLWSNYPNTITRYGAMAKVEWEPSPMLRTGASLGYYIQYDDELRLSQRLRNQTGGNASFVRFNDFPLEKPLIVGQTFLDWRIGENQTLSTRASYSEATFFEPSNEIRFDLTTPAATFDVSTVAGGVPVATNLSPRLTNPANYVLQNNRYLQYEDDSDEYVQEFGLDYGFNAEAGDRGFGFGAGLKWREITRDNQRTETTSTFAGAPLTLDRFQLTDDYTPIYANFDQLFIDAKALQAFFSANSASVTVVRDERVANDWVFEEQVGAAYGLLRHAGDRHLVIIGGRFEDTQTTVERNRAEGGVNTRVTREGSYDHFLPSLTIGFEITEQLRLRAAAFQAIGRPDPSQLASGESVNSAGVLTRGNPDLQAREGDSYEASLEYYLPENRGLFAIGVFRKEIENEIVTRLTPDGGPSGEDVSQPVNVTTAEVTGVELSAVLNNLPLPGLLANFGVSANATFIDGSFDTGGTRGTVDFLQGQSDFLANLALFYEQGPFRARIAYAHIDEARTSVSPTVATGLADRIDKATNNVDVQTRFAISDNFELIGEVRNLSDEDKVNYTGANIYRDVSVFGRQFWVGTSVKF